MAEPRRPVADLPGFGETSISTARPIDAFAGAPQFDKKNALAEAFSNLGKAGQKAAAQAEAKREKERLDLMAVEAEGTARKMIAESETGFINAVQLGEQYADLSDAIVARIVIRENSDAFYNMTKDKLSGLGDGIVMDKAGLDAMYSKLEEEAINATDGFIHAQSGALDGVQRAVQEMSGQHASRRDGIVRKRAETVTAGQVTTLLNSTSDVATIVEGLTAIDAEPSPFDNVGRKSIIVDALLAWDKNNPGSEMMHEKIIEAVPWLKGAVTDAKVTNAQGAITSARMTHLRNQIFLDEVADDEKFETNKSNVNAITMGDATVSDQIAQLEQLQSDMAIAAADTNATPRDRKIANATYDYIESALRGLEVDVDTSAKNILTVRTQIISEATIGSVTVAEAIKKVEAIDNARPQDKAALIAEIPNLIQGLGIISTDAHNTAYRQRLGSVVDAYDKNPQLIGKQFALSGAGETADSIARDIWDNTTISLIETYMEENDGQPPNALAMRGIYDQAEKIVQERLALISQINEKGDVRGQVDRIVNPVDDPDYDATKDPASPQFAPIKGEIYPAPKGQGDVEYLGVNPDNPFAPENWKLVTDEGEGGEGNDGDTDVGTDDAPTVSSSRRITDEQRDAKEAEDGDYAALGELFDQSNQVFNLPEDTLNSLLEQVTNTPLKRRQTSVPESVIKDIILKELGLEGNSYFDFGGLDGANLDGEVAVKKLIERLKELDQR